jgi:adenylate cyclase
MVANSPALPALRVTDPDTQRETVFELSSLELFQIGRAQNSDILVEGDREVSREHAQLTLENGRARVACLPGASNPIVWGGRPLREVVVPPGGQFRIGRTVFEFVAGQGSSTDRIAENQETADVQEITLTSDELEHAAFGDPIRQLDLICTLPEMIASALSDIELERLLAELLLEAIPESVAVSAAQFDSDVVSALRDGILVEHCDLSRPTTMRTCTREDFEGRFRPSRRLIASTLRSGLSTIQLRGRSAASQTGAAGGLDWAFCVPVPGDGQEGWCLYVAGSGGRDGAAMPTHEHLLGNVRFAHVLAQFIGSIRHVRRLQDHKTQLSSYFSPNVVENLTGNQNDVLAATAREISVLFCDVHGFSRKAEECEDDLQHLLECVKEVLGVMTHGILCQRGTIGDFQGDAALGFWGWPVSLDDGASSACQAALAIQKEFHRTARENDLLDGFSIGMGIAHGEAIAGQIGTRQQAKIGVFGPVVNQGSRLEGMTRQFGVSICIDENSARCVRTMLTPDVARVRKLARVRPKGMRFAIDVYELLSSCGPDSSVSDKHIIRFEAALKLVTAGHWTDAIIALSQLPDEGPKTFLVDHMRQFDNTPPADWDGVFSLTSK